jgi:hypothetical protein
MRKLLILALATGLLIWGLAVGAGSASAACGTKCMSKQLKKLRGQIGRLNAQVGSLNAQVGSLNAQVQTLSADNACIRRLAVTQYYGYDYASSFYTTALDFTESGSAIDAWMLAVEPGTCGTSTSRTGSAGRATGVFQPLQPDGSPQRKD